MGIVQRIGRTLKGKTGRLLDRWEDPAASFEYARIRQREMLGEVRQRLEEVRTERAALAVRLGQSPTDAERQKAATLGLEEENLLDAERRLQDRITEFDSLATRIAAAKTAEQAGRAANRVSSDFADFVTESDLRASAAQVDAELGRLEAELRRQRRG